MLFNLQSKFIKGKIKKNTENKQSLNLFFEESHVIDLVCSDVDVFYLAGVVLWLVVLGFLWRELL